MITDLDLPVLAKAEVVVCGAGPAGVAAALAAARSGARVILLEQTGCCGGMSTAGLVPVFIHMSDRKNLVAAGICHEIISEMCRRMGQSKINFIWQHIHPEILKQVYDEKLSEAGVTTFFDVKVADTIMNGDTLNAVAVATVQGLKKICGKVWVDATGDGIVAAAAGVPFELGDAQGKTMSPTLCVQYSNIDLEAMREAEQRGEGAIPLWKKHKQQIPLAEHHIIGISEYGNGSGSGNLGHIYDVNTLDEAERSHCYTEGRRVANIIHDFYVKYVPGYEKSDLTATASLLGIRESRRILGEYQLTLSDYLEKRHFPDDIGCFYYGIDIHASSTNPEEQLNVGKRMDECNSSYEPGDNYGIPYRALIARKVRNLLVAGRCISAERSVQASLRVMPCCMITGVAAGCAAALAKDDGEIRALPAESLQREIRTTGAYLP